MTSDGNSIIATISGLFKEVNDIIRFILDHDDILNYDDGVFLIELRIAVRRRSELYGVMRRVNEVETNGGVCEDPDVARYEIGEADFRMFMEEPRLWIAKRINELRGDIEALGRRARSHNSTLLGSRRHAVHD